MVWRIKRYKVLLREAKIHNFTSQLIPKEIITMENTTEPKFGFNNFAETWNGRLAMLGFVIGLATELVTGQGILSQIGIM